MRPATRLLAIVRARTTCAMLIVALLPSRHPEPALGDDVLLDLGRPAAHGEARLPQVLPLEAALQRRPTSSLWSSWPYSPMICIPAFAMCSCMSVLNSFAIDDS